MRRAAVASATVAARLAAASGAGIYTPPPGDSTPSWSPDGRRLAFRTNRDGGGVKVVSASGGRESWIVQGPVSSYAISPDWSRIAYQVGGEMIVTRLDGGERRSLASRPGLPAWAPDSRRLAFTGPDNRVYVLHADGAEAPRPLVEGFDPVWSPDGSRIAYVAGPRNEYPGTRRAPEASSALELTTGRESRLLGPTLEPRYADDGSPAFSRDGSRLAFAGGRECRDRIGIFVVRASGRGATLRASNDCHILGTKRDDLLRGTPQADVLLGLEGDDRLFAVGAAYVGDSLSGDSGADVLVGGPEADTLEGGAGDDLLLGGKSGDVLVGGPGRDHLKGQAGPDVIHARDGRRDVVSCGPNPPGGSTRDEVVADRLDRVTRDCEIVRRWK